VLALMRQGVRLDVQVIVERLAAGACPLLPAHIPDRMAGPARPLLGLRFQLGLQPVLQLLGLLLPLGQFADQFLDDRHLDAAVGGAAELREQPPRLPGQRLVGAGTSCPSGLLVRSGRAWMAGSEVSAGAAGMGMASRRGASIAGTASATGMRAAS